MRLYELIICFFFILTNSCNNTLQHEKQSICKEGIQIRMADSKINLITNYQLFEVSDYPEDIIMNLNKVSSKYRHKDSAGIVCLPLFEEDSLHRLRKFAIIKKGYVFTVYFLKNRHLDTTLIAIRL